MSPKPFYFVVAVVTVLGLVAPAQANLFKDLKKALEDVEKELAPLGNGGTGNGTAQQSGSLSSNGASAPASASQPDDFGDSESFIKSICEPILTSSIYKKLASPDIKAIENDFGR